MRAGLLLTATLIGLGNTGTAEAHGGCRHTQLVASFYHDYLGRAPDACGLNGWVVQLRHGMSPLEVEACILGSEEYYCRHGHCPRRFVTALYYEVLGRRPCREEVESLAASLHRCGCRKTLAYEVLRLRGRPLAVAPVEPVYVPRPVYVERPAYVPVPRARPHVSFGITIRR